MATLNIGGKRVKVDDAFLSLPPDQQQATVDEIAAQIGAAPQEQPRQPIMQLKGGPGPINPNKSPLPGPLGQFQDFSNAVQSGFNQGLTFGFGDEIFAGATAPFRAIGPAMEGKGYDIGKAYDEGLSQTREIDANQAALNPVAATVGEIGGAVLNPASRLALGSKAASLLPRMAGGAVSGAGIGGVYGFGKGEEMDDRLSGAALGAATGGVIGGAAPMVSGVIGNMLTKGAQRKATTAAIKGAPSAADLKAASSAMFQQVDQSGVTIDPNKFGQFVADQVRWAKSKRIHPQLDQKAAGAYETLIQALDDVQKSGGALTMSDMHTLRQIAQKAAVSAEGRDAMFAGRIVDGLDDFITKPGVAVLPANRLGQGTNAAGNELMKAISTWGRARRVGMIEEAITKAQTYQSGFENGLRLQFQALLRNPKTRKLFSAAELQAIEEVANGTALSNVTRLLGKFGFGPNNMLGGTIGASIGFGAGGVPGMLASGAIGAGARKVSAAMANRAANRAAQVVATPNIPTIGAGPKQLALQDMMQRLGLAGSPALVQR